MEFYRINSSGTDINSNSRVLDYNNPELRQNKIIKNRNKILHNCISVCLGMYRFVIENVSLHLTMNMHSNNTF